MKNDSILQGTQYVICLTTIQFVLCARNFFFFYKKKTSVCTLIEVKFFNGKNYGKFVSVNMQINVILRDRMSWNFEFNFSPFIERFFIHPDCISYHMQCTWMEVMF